MLLASDSSYQSPPMPIAVPRPLQILLFSLHTLSILSGEPIAPALAQISATPTATPTVTPTATPTASTSPVVSPTGSPSASPSASSPPASSAATEPAPTTLPEQLAQIWQKQAIVAAYGGVWWL
ncbi:MAG: hypothetical protein MUF72_19755 [Elainella sp. Prado103]|nr:hypothetical protein [Elainella sp. Prado103]